jgi:sterol desaturase/sphingolipid hydroxylase (fatty acid hydroxylase superfamily)
VATAAGAAVVATVADVVARKGDGPLPPAGSVPSSFLDPQAPNAADADAGSNREERRGLARWARKVGSSAAVTAVAAGAVAAGATWASRTTAKRLWDKRIVRDLGDGPLAVAGAILAWDLLYYWNHRLAHESRYLWAMHVVHHSSEHYNLSTALRQPVADALVVTIPYSALALLGFRPEVIETARGVNLLYQFWVHTEVIDSLGKAEKIMNSPSLHRVHHGSNRKYLDRNHAGIFIIWDRLFGTHQLEDEPVVYGLTTNIETFDPLKIASHEFADILEDVGHATTWRDRLSYVLRGPGWAYERRTGHPVPAPGAPPVGEDADEPVAAVV